MDALKVWELYGVGTIRRRGNCQWMHCRCENCTLKVWELYTTRGACVCRGVHVGP